MIITYKYKPIFNSNDFEEFKKFTFNKYLRNRSYKIIMPEVEVKLNYFFYNSDKSNHKKLYDFCYTLIGNISWTKQEFWIKRGWSRAEAVQQISEKQRQNALKYVKKRKENPNKYKKSSTTNIEYWINKGYSKENAIIKLKERQTTFSMKKLIQKYGIEEASKKMNERNDKWQKSLYKNNDMNKVNKSKAVSFDKMVHKYGYEAATIKYNNWVDTSRKICINNLQNFSIFKASKQSLEIFQEFYDKMIKLFSINKIYIGIENNREFFIKSNNRLCFYDFTIKPLKLIFEYNGSHVHPNKEKLNEEEWNNWTHRFTHLSANEVYKLDQEKIQFAKNDDFDVIEIWDSDTTEYNKQIVSESIKQKLNKFF